VHLADEQIKFLEEKANKIRKDIIEMLVEAKSGHSAGSLGMADIFTAFYFHILNHDSKIPVGKKEIIWFFPMVTFVRRFMWQWRRQDVSQ
jgi:transketolase N-terminal domain/subunit